jgi:hypothetical protein
MIMFSRGVSDLHKALGLKFQAQVSKGQPQFPNYIVDRQNSIRSYIQYPALLLGYWSPVTFQSAPPETHLIADVSLRPDSIQ